MVFPYKIYVFIGVAVVIYITHPDGASLVGPLFAVRKEGEGDCVFKKVKSSLRRRRREAAQRNEDLQLACGRPIARAEGNAQICLNHDF